MDKKDLKIFRSLFDTLEKDEDYSSKQEEFIQETLMSEIYTKVYEDTGFHCDERRVKDQGRVNVYTDNAQKICWYDYQSQLETIYHLIETQDHDALDDEYEWACDEVIKKGADWIINRIGDPKDYYVFV